MSEEPRKAPDISISRKPRRKSGISKLIPFLMFFLFALFILKEQFPVLDDKYQSVVNPAQFKAIKACRREALSKSQTPEFARLIRNGEANKTLNGYFVDRIIVGELSPGAGESRYVVTCHIGQEGEVVNVHAEPYVPAAPEPEPFRLTPDQDD